MSERIPDGWELQKFGNIAKVVNGFAFKSSDFTDSSVGNHPIVRMSNLKNGKVDFRDAKFVLPQTVKDLDNFHLNDGDFLFGMSGSLDNYGWITKSNGDCYLNQRVGKLSPSNSNSKFSAYLFLSHVVRSEIEKMAAGAAQLNISAKQVESIFVPCPPKPEQQKIASILTSVDEVIEKTESQISKLQDLKKGMMQELLTKGIGHTEFRDSPVGRIPKGWELVSVDGLAYVKGGKRLPKGRPFAGYKTPYPYIRISDFDNGFVSTDNIQYVFPEDRDRIKRYTITKDDICVSIAGVYLGLFVEIPNQLDNALLTENAAKIVFKHPDSVNKTFIRYLCQSELVQSQLLQEKGVGAGVPKLALFRIAETLLPIPPKAEQDEIANTMKSIDNRIVHSMRKLHHLNQVKKALMQDLLTGNVRVVV